MCKAFATHRGVAFEQRFVLHHCLIDGKSGTDVLHNGSNVDGNGWRSRNLSAGDSIDKLLFAALRVLRFECNHLNSRYVGRLLTQQVNGLGLVLFNTNVTTADLCSLHQ